MMNEHWRSYFAVQKLKLELMYLPSLLFFALIEW